MEDALHAESQGVDAIGFVFVEKSKRHIQLAQAAEISCALGLFITRVGLFLNAPEKTVAQALDSMPNLVPQFHGTESAAYCESFGRPYIKAIGLGEGMPAKSIVEGFPGADGLLFDSNAAGELGGTGHSFDWQLLKKYSGKKLILAGGLNDTNVRNAIEQVKPYAVDVSTGVEASPGVKNPEKVSRFVRKVRSAA